MGQNRRLIDAEALKKELQLRHEAIMQDPELDKGLKWREALCYGRTTDILEKCPTVDAVEVVRCRDCKNSQFWYTEKPIGGEAIGCRVCLRQERPKTVHDEDFCSYGERRDDGEA